ncbi:DNA-binding GntR family transcriptional regulator [Mesorhizobium soli]|uniref:GntR family transcriptional regulator n=1 Tax=Pseudaminobacter soli (ex Li et al. 2025) TaxID=1295366 RepID=UPI00247645F0|nr:GntR family transcriptional regulator [Mesorhizobium soli]MDH6234596.1 DNA-binding GntR family transcriptional regulator [Mesorhizobium soli]
MSSETLAQAAYSRIKQDILQGRIKPDTVLSERELAEQQGISRTPLRSALSRLEREHVISRLQNGVLLVRSVSVEQLIEIVQLRQALESAAAARAAEFGLTAELAGLREVMTAYANGRNVAFDDFWAEDDKFHLAVARAARLELLPAILAEQRAIARRCTITRTHDSFADQAREHIAVIDAIAAGDGVAARAAMSLHFENVRARFLGWLSR